MKSLLLPLFVVFGAQTAVFAAADIADGKVTFSIKAPKAAEVRLKGQWSKQDALLTRGGDGLWSSEAIEVPAGVWEYSFQVDGLNVLDPQNTAIKPQRMPQKSILHLAATPPAAWDWQAGIPHGTVHTHVFDSKQLGVPREVVVYTPPGYEKGAEKLPLLVLQHGSGDNQRGWTEHGKAHWILDHLIAVGKAKPMLVMMLDGHPHGMVPRDDKAKRGDSLAAFQKELFKDALPLVEANYRVLPGQGNRAIAGLSMGGWQSLTIGLNATDRFAYIGSFSGAADTEVVKAAMDDSVGTNAKLKLLWIACGKDDFLLERNNTLITALKAANVNHEWHLTEGDHSWPVWRGYLSEFLPRLFQP
jgi:enterochelin esterase-like enzyme